MTSKDETRENRDDSAQEFHAVEPDSRIVALVRLLARRAAEHDFALLLKSESARGKPAD